MAEEVVSSSATIDLTLTSDSESGTNPAKFSEDEITNSTNQTSNGGADDEESRGKREENGTADEVVTGSEDKHGQGDDEGDEALAKDNGNNDKPKESDEKEGEAGKVSSSRPMSQPTKRRPEKELNHLNWDEEDEPEEKGEFVKATEDKLKERKILTAKRKQKPATEAKVNPFGGLSLSGGSNQLFGGFGSTTTTSTSSGAANMSFSFGCTRPQASSVPNFDFGSVTSSSSKCESNEVTESTTNNLNNSQSSKKQKTEEAAAASSSDAGGGDGVSSATSV